MPPPAIKEQLAAKGAEIHDLEQQLADHPANQQLKADKADVAESMAGLREDFSKRLDTAEDDLHERLDNQDQNMTICWDGVCVPSCGLVPSARPSPR